MGFCCFCKSKDIEKEDYFGPNSSRKCRDIIWLLLFIVFWIGMIVVAILGFVNGEIKHYYYGTDMYGNMCSDDNKHRDYIPSENRIDYSDKTYVYYPNPFEISISFCVKTCPTVDDVGKTFKFHNNETYPLYPSVYVLNRCVPDLTALEDVDIYNATIGNLVGAEDQKADEEKIGKSVTDLLTADSWFTRMVSDTSQLWWLILVCIAVAFVVSFLWLFVVRFLVGAMTWLLIALCFAALLALTVYLWGTCDTLNADSGHLVYEFVDASQLRTALRVLSVILLVVTILFFFMIIFLRRRVKLAIAVIKEASKALRASPCLIFFPIIQFLAFAVFMVYWIVVLLFLASSYDRSDTVNVTINGYTPSVSVMYLTIYHIFGGLWTIFWISGVGQTTVAGAVADRYWSSADERSVLGIGSSLYRTLRYSSGSVALGALLMATVKFVRLIFEYFSRVKAKAAKKNIRWLSCLLKIVSCCIWCFEKVIKWVTESGYIMVAITGKSFCVSAMHAISLQAGNFIRILVLKGITFFTLSVTRFAIATICALIAAIVSYNYSHFTDVLENWYTTSTLHFWYVPVIIIFIGSYIVAGVFTNVYHTSIDTIMLSFCEDESQNGTATNQKLAKLMKKGKVDDESKKKNDDGSGGNGKEMKERKHKSSSKPSKTSSHKEPKKKESSKPKRDELMLN